MGKKYLETKRNSLESSILGLWQEAAKKTESVDIDEATGKEIAAKMMTDKSMKAFASKVAKMKVVSRDDLEKMLPDYVDGGAITKLFKEDTVKKEIDLKEATGKEIAAKMMKDKSMKAFASKVAKMKTVTRDDLEKLLPDYVDGGSITGLFKEEVNEGTWALPKTPKEKDALKKLLSKPLKAKDASKKLYDIIGDDKLSDDVDDFAEKHPNDDVRAIVKSHMKRMGIKEGLDEGTKEEYQKFFNAAMKKFGIDSPADLKSDEEKKKFFDYVDKNYKGEKDEEFNAFMKEKLGESFEFGTLEYRNHALNVTPGETDPEWARARDFKVASMKEALAKVWGLDEKALDKSSKEAYDEEDEELKPVPGSKTMTGGKVAKVDTKPKID